MSQVTVAVPNQGSIRSELSECLLRLAADNRGHELAFDLSIRKHSTDNARNWIVREFLAGDGDYLLMIDEDNPPLATANPLSLVEQDLDVAICPTPVFHPDPMGRFGWVWNVFTDEQRVGWKWIEAPTADGVKLEEVDAGGTGCILIARRVLEKVKPPFIREWDDDGCITKGSDLLFCQRAKEAGFKVWCSWEHHCHHITPVDQLATREIAIMRDVSWINRGDTNTPSYWDEQWSARGERILPFYDSIAKLLGGKRVLDYACGRGDLLSMLGPNASGYDFSPEAVTICRERGLRATIEPSVLLDRWDAIVCCEFLEHADDPEDLLRRFFASTDLVVYSVPNNCMPPGMEPEHRRVFTDRYCKRITPHFKQIIEFGYWMVVVAERQS